MFARVKAKLEIVPRPTDTGRNAPGEVQAALRRDRYKGELESELGIDRAAQRRTARRPSRSIDWGTVTATFILALVTFTIVFAALLWRDGRLPRLWPEATVEWRPQAPNTDWMLSGERTGPFKAASKSGTAAKVIVPTDDPAPDISVTVLPRGPGTPPADESDDSGGGGDTE
jgi:hypothetical protein